MGASSSSRAIVCVCQWERYDWRVGQCWRDWKGVDDWGRGEGSEEWNDFSVMCLFAIDWKELGWDEWRVIQLFHGFLQGVCCYRKDDLSKQYGKTMIPSRVMERGYPPFSKKRDDWELGLIAPITVLDSIVMILFEFKTIHGGEGYSWKVHHQGRTWKGVMTVIADNGIGVLVSSIKPLIRKPITWWRWRSSMVVQIQSL